MFCYLIYEPTLELLNNKDIVSIESFNFISTYIIKTRVNFAKYLSKNCVYYNTFCDTRSFVQLNKVRSFINVNKVYKSNLFGAGVGVAIIDTGCACSLDVVIPSKRIKAFKDFVNNKKFMYDDNGHGTFVSGIIGGNGLQSCGKYSGIAPLCDLIVLKALDANGEGTQNNILAAMQWIIENKKALNIKVVCMSFGCKASTEFDALSYGAHKLWQSGLVVVAACGNDGPVYNSITSPGIARDIITVGALDELFDNQIKVAPFSSRGSKKYGYVKPDILAPGTNVVSLSNKVGFQTYTVMSGTSTSTPIIAGVCALLLQKYPQATPSMIKSILIKNAFDLGENKYAQGKGAFKYS